MGRVGLATRRAISLDRTFFALFLGQRKDMHEHWEHPRILNDQAKGSAQCRRSG
jgi:hypothetical protein